MDPKQGTGDLISLGKAGGEEVGKVNSSTQEIRKCVNLRKMILIISAVFST